MALPSHTTHILQPLDVYIFQPLKHWHSKAVMEVIQNGNITFAKIKFLNAFHNKAFKWFTCLSAWKQTGLIPLNPEIILIKVCEILAALPPWPITPPQPIYRPIAHTPKTITELTAASVDLLIKGLPPMLEQPLFKVIHGANAQDHWGVLMEERFNQQIAAQAAQKAHKLKPNS